MHPYPIAHFRTPYLSYTETFIYGILRHLGGAVRPIVFTTEVKNRDQFPFEDVVNYSLKPFSVGWFIHQFRKKIFGMNGFFLMQELKEKRVALIHAHFGEQGFELLDIKKKMQKRKPRGFRTKNNTYSHIEGIAHIFGGN